MQWSGLTDTTREKELATALTEARAEIERLGQLLNSEQMARTNAEAEIEEVRRTAKHLLIAANIYQDRALAAESELATLRDMLTLCGELGGMKPGETMADYLRRLIDEVAGKATERELAKSAAITAYLAQREKEGWVMVPVGVAVDARRYQWLRDENAYAPEEENVTGGDELDALCDECLAAAQNGGELPPPPRGK